MQVNNNTQVVMYFANDGGIYRALDGYTGLTTEDVWWQQSIRQLESDTRLDDAIRFLLAAS